MVGITYIATKTANTQLVCKYTVVLMGGNTEKWMNRLEVHGNAPNSFLEIEKLFINQYSPLDDENIAHDKLYEL